MQFAKLMERHRPDGRLQSGDTITLFIGPVLFEFESFDDWVRCAQQSYSAADVDSRTAIAVDSFGRACVVGRDFRVAQEDSAYPVKVYLLRPTVIEREAYAGV